MTIAMSETTCDCRVVFDNVPFERKERRSMVDRDDQDKYWDETVKGFSMVPRIEYCPRHAAVETLEQQVIALRTELNHSVLCTVYQEECDKVEALERRNAKLHEMVIDVNSVMMSERGHRFENIMRSFQTRIDAMLAESTPAKESKACPKCGKPFQWEAGWWCPTCCTMPTESTPRTEEGKR